jgi:hypothetical protein
VKQYSYLFLALILSACVAQPLPEPTSTASVPIVIKSADNPYASKPEDANLKIAGVVLTSMDLAEHSEDVPVRVVLRIIGSLPRTCNALRIDVIEPNEQYQINVRVYSLIDPNVDCDNVFQLFEASILLGVYSAGRYTVWVNGSYVGDFVTYN